MWDVATHRQLGRPLTGHTGIVNAVAFSPDGKTLASGSLDQTVRLWDVARRRELGGALTAHTDGGNVVAFDRYGMGLSSSTVESVAFSPEGKTLASATAGGTIELWDVSTGRQLGPPLTGHTDIVTSAAFSPDGQILASGTPTARSACGATIRSTTTFGNSAATLICPSPRSCGSKPSR